MKLNPSIKTPNWPFFSEEEIEAVSKVLKSGAVNYWTGNVCKSFEKEFAQYVGVEYAIAMANGTVALEAALLSCGIGPGDDVIVTCRTFIASASCVVMRGAKPIMADVDPNTQNITLDTIKAALTPNTKAIILVHLSGWPCDMDEILEFAGKNNLKVIEDCAQSHGATYKGKMVGSFGDAAAFSFCQDKIMTTGGEGGMLTTNNPEIWDKVWSFKDHGKSFKAVSQNQEDTVGYRWLHESFGTNFRMTEMQAAIGRIQLRKLPQWLEKRRQNAAILNESFSRIPSLRLTLPPKSIGHAYYKYYAFIKPNALNAAWSRDRIIKELKLRGVFCQSGTCAEIYKEKAFTSIGIQPKESLPVAKELGDTSLMFLVHPTLDQEELLRCCRIVEEVFAEATSLSL